MNFLARISGRMGAAGPRDDQRSMGERIRNDDRFQREGLGDRFGGEDVPGCAVCDDATFGHHDQVIGESCGEIQIVQDDDDRRSLLTIERAQQFEQVELVTARTVVGSSSRRIDGSCASAIAIHAR